MWSRPPYGPAPAPSCLVGSLRLLGLQAGEEREREGSHRRRLMASVPHFSLAQSQSYDPPEMQVGRTRPSWGSTTSWNNGARCMGASPWQAVVIAVNPSRLCGRSSRLCGVSHPHQYFHTIDSIPLLSPPTPSGLCLCFTPVFQLCSRAWLSNQPPSESSLEFSSMKKHSAWVKEITGKWVRYRVIEFLITECILRSSLTPV